jgi:glycerol uptake facilitator-like aquaporin
MVTLNINPPNLMQVAASFGFGIMCLAQFVGPLSSGHINCAVTFGLFIGGRTTFKRLVYYTFYQALGSVLGAFFLWAIFGTRWPAARAFGSNSWDPDVFTGGQVFLAEIMGTMLLVYNVFATIDIPGGGGGALGVYPIAMSVMVAHLFLLPIDGCSINPTRSFGPSLVAAWAGIGGSYYYQQYMFWFGPLFGAFFAAVIYGTSFLPSYMVIESFLV